MSKNRFDSKDALLGHSYSKSVTTNWVLVLSNPLSAVSTDFKFVAGFLLEGNTEIDGTEPQGAEESYQ